MSATELPSEPVRRSTIPVELRAQGRLFLEARRLGERTVRGVTEEFGPSRVRFPLSGRRGSALEAVLINTGGGIAGGDSAHFRAHCAQSAHLVITTQAAEKVYRSDGATSVLGVDLKVGDGATLEWMPQATILFDGARVERAITAEVASDARLLLIEPLVLGRTARGESLRSGRLFDSWRIRREGRLIYADGLRLDGDIAATLARRAVANKCPALATILLVAPDAESRLEAVRAALGIAAESTEEAPRQVPNGAPIGASIGIEAGASAWDGMLSVRLLAQDGAKIDSAIRRMMGALGVAEPPRIWHS